MVSGSTRPIHVLLIDDDEDEFVVIRDVLLESRDTTYKLDWVGTFDQAMERLSEQVHDVCLVDYRLGARSGVELIQMANQSGYRGPMILLTGFGDRETEDKAMEIGAADYLKKAEITPYLLDRSIRYAIYRTHMRAQAVSQDRMASIGMLASSLAHEIGTPLGVIRGRAEYLAMQVAGDGAVRKNVDVILSQIDRVSHLIRSLLNLARGDSNEVLGATSVNRAAKDVFDLMDHELKRHDIQAGNSLSAEKEIKVLGQAQKLHQVLLNVVVNGVHAIQKAKAEGRTTGHFIRLRVRDLGAQWSIDVEDSGCGISEDDMPNLFRPFFTTKQDGVGTGLGLATSQWIIQSWGGSIDIESQAGRGTVVSFRIPKA